MFEKFTCTLADGRTVTVDINTETYFISDAFSDDPGWMPNGKERNEIVYMYLDGRKRSDAIRRRGIDAHLVSLAQMPNRSTND